MFTMRFLKNSATTLCFVSSLSLCFASDSLLEVQENSTFVPQHLGKVRVTHDEQGFHVIKDDTKYDVKKYFVDSSVRDLTSEQLSKFLKVGYLSVGKIEDQDFSLKAHVRGPGGGPLLGVVAGLGTVVGIVGSAATGNVPAFFALIYGAPAIIGGAIIAPTP